MGYKTIKQYFLERLIELKAKREILSEGRWNYEYKKRVKEVEYLLAEYERWKYPDTEYRQLTIPDVRQRCIDFAKWIKKQNLMICTGYDDSDCNWRSSMIGGKKYTDEQLYDIFERGGNVA